MRLKYGPVTTVAQESITGRLLIDEGIVDPDFMPTIMSSFVEESPFMSLLDAKNYKTKGVNYFTNFDLNQGDRYKTVSSYHVQYRMEFSDMRHEHFRSNVKGVTFVDDANPTKPGLNKQQFYIYLDSNWIGGHEIILLADGKTQLFVDTKKGGEPQGGVYRYSVKVHGNRNDEYVPSYLMADGVECQFAMTSHPQDFSEFGNEKYTFNGYGDAYLTLQRVKYSYSGTAQAMVKNRKTVQGRWVTGGDGQTNFLTVAHEKMLKTAAKILDFQLLEGKCSVNVDTKKCLLTNADNQEIVTGAGVMYANDGPIEYPQNNGWTPKWTDSFVEDIAEYIRPDEEGNREAVVFLPIKSFLSFNRCMKEMGVTRDHNIEGTSDEKFINNTYSGYELGGIKLLVKQYERLTQRPGIALKDGTMSNDHDGLVIPLGRTISGQRGIELIQLRPAVEGTLAGINEGGEFIPSSTDGSSHHILLQNGVVSQNQVIKIYKPLTGNIL